MSTSAIRFKEAVNQNTKLSREFEESRDRYVFYPGPAPDGVLAIPAYEHDVGIDSIERGVVTQIQNHKQIIRDPDERGTVNAEVISSDRAIVKVTIRAALIANWFERRYGVRGAKSLTALVGLPEASVALIIGTLLPVSDTEELKKMSLPKMRKFITLSSEKISDSSSPLPLGLHKPALKTAEEMLQAIDQAEAYCLGYLQDLKSEMHQRRSNGKGITSLSSTVEKQLLPLVEKKASEYQIDSEELERLRMDQIASMMRNNQPQDTATVIAAVLQALNIAPLPSPDLAGRGVPLPETTPTRPLVVDPVELPEEEEEQDTEESDQPLIDSKPRLGRPPRR